MEDSSFIIIRKSYIWKDTVSQVKTKAIFTVLLNIAQHKITSLLKLRNDYGHGWKKPTLTVGRIREANINLRARHFVHPALCLYSNITHFILCSRRIIPSAARGLEHKYMGAFADTTDAVICLRRKVSKFGSQGNNWNIKLPNILMVSPCKPLLCLFAITSWHLDLI